ncbi:MAG: long-chain fatty acid--CoA ligase [Rubrivivax sp. SCN 70-15]|nr:MAG: long-chain fatty acid--CoA ligase [Rubrivivax sp. SCN 70-15]
MATLLTLSDVVATHARLQPGKVAVRDSRRALTYAQWDERASRLANAFIEGLGLQRGDRVAVLAYNRLEWLEIYAGLARAGLVAVPINFRLLGPEIAYIVGHCEARALIVQSELRDRVEAVAGEIAVDAARRVELTAGADARASVGWRGYEALLAAASAAPPEVAVGDADLFALMYTSGTTGLPKGAMRSHGGNALIALVTALEFGLTRGDTGLLVMPLCHANSLYFGLTFAHLGATIVVDDRAHFDPEALLATLARERVTFTSLVPTHYIMMLGLSTDVKARHDTRAVDKLLISSAPARRDTKLAILEHFAGCRLFELYGSTEAGWVSILRPDEQLEHLGSVGREWVGSGPVRLLDPDGREVPDGEVGELYSRTPWVFDGYWKNPEKTAEAFRGAWCSVGDLARRDAQGYLHLVDRKSNMIISGGENIYPSEVEAVLATHPAVKDVAVVGLPDATWGEAVHAVVVLHDGRDASQTELIDWCRARLAGYKRPRAVSFVCEHELPRTATGKVQHRVLRQRMLAEAGVAQG